MKDDAPTAENKPQDTHTITAGCVCGKAIHECGDCSDLVGALERQSGLSPGAIVSEPLKAGGWCAPSACGAGICRLNDPHDETCEGPGSAYERMEGADWSHMLELPALSVTRGGFKFSRFPVYTTVKKQGFREFYVTVRTHTRPDAELIGPFARRKHANNAKKVIDDMNRILDSLWTKEKNSDR